MINAAAIINLRVLRMRPSGALGLSSLRPRTRGALAMLKLEAAQAQGQPGKIPEGVHHDVPRQTARH